MAMIPLLVARLLAKGGKLSDTEFMAIKTFEGKMLSEHTQVSAEDANVTINIITPATGKTFYHFFSSMSSSSALAPNSNVECGIRNNGVVVDNLGYTAIGSGGTTQHNKSNIASELIGDGIKDFDHRVFWNSSTPDRQFSFTLQGWIEDTGTSPQVPAI